jgi:coenzyme F420-reducing hydrogenase beta subunit
MSNDADTIIARPDSAATAPVSAKGYDLNDVVKSGMCIACGACTFADPGVNLVFNEETLQYDPDSRGTARSASICPAIAVDYQALQDFRFPGATPSEHGVVDTVCLAQNTAAEKNLQASSGGVVKEALCHLLRSKSVDGVVALDHAEGLNFRYVLAATEEAIENLPGSIYHVNAATEALKIILETPGRLALVAIPCQLEGILSYLRTFCPEEARKINFIIGLSCGWYYTHHALRAICRYKRIDFDSLSNVAFRGGGPVGKLVLETPQGTTRVSRRTDFDYQAAFDRSYNLARCHLCVNHVNFLADLVVADAWLPATVGTRTGISLIICRNKRATELLKQMAAEERVRLADASTEDIVASQKRRNAFGDFAYAYADYLRKIGEFVPLLPGPNEPAAQRVDEEAVISFHREVVHKRQLQQAGKYRLLWWRKMTIGLPKLAATYLRWFIVRILHIPTRDSGCGSVDRAKLRDFT